MGPTNRCANHPDQPSVGICVSCRRFVCEACVTRIQGVNHCRECLEKLYAPVIAEAPEKKVLRRLVSPWITAIGLFGLLFVVLYLGLALILLGR